MINKRKQHHSYCVEMTQPDANRTDRNQWLNRASRACQTAWDVTPFMHS